MAQKKKAKEEATGTDVARIKEEFKVERIREAGRLPAEFWPDERISAIAKTVAPAGTTLPELALFLSVAQKYDLDPMVNEIWLAEDKRKGRHMVLTGRDAYLKIAMRDPAFLGVNSGVVYENDHFVLTKKADGGVAIDHQINSFADRGKIAGAYAVCYHGKRVPVVKVRTWQHYSSLHGRLTWISNPDDMIETRVIVAAVRQQFNISGLYTESEMAGISEDDDGEASKNVLTKTKTRLDELRQQLEQARAEQPDEDEGVEDAEFEVVEEEADHAPVTVGMDAAIVDEEQPATKLTCTRCGKPYPCPTPDECARDPEVTHEEIEADQQAELLKKLHARYMVLWKEVVGAPTPFRQGWQGALTNKASTKEWGEYEYKEAIAILEEGGEAWAKYVQPAKQKG